MFRRQRELEMPDIDLIFIAEQLKRVLADTSDLKTRMSAIENHLGRIHLDIAAMRAGHLEQRLDQIERRLVVSGFTIANASRT